MKPGRTRLKPWETLACKEVFAVAPWVKLSVLQVRLPGGRVVDDYYQITLLDYAGVFAQTTDGRIIIERQYKHGVGRVSLMLPGGIIEDGEGPIATAQRELLEETGYVSNHWQPLGSFVTDTNHGCAKAHLFIARNARQITVPNSGDLEEMEIILMEPDEIIHAIHNGDVVALGAVAAIALALNPMLNTHHDSTETRASR